MLRRSCDLCTRRKVKCDGNVNKTCSGCAKRKIPCVFSRKKGKVDAHVSVTENFLAFQSSTLSLNVSMENLHLAANETHRAFDPPSPTNINYNDAYVVPCSQCSHHHNSSQCHNSESGYGGTPSRCCTSGPCCNGYAQYQQCASCPGPPPGAHHHGSSAHHHHGTRPAEQMRQPKFESRAPGFAHSKGGFKNPSAPQHLHHSRESASHLSNWAPLHEGRTEGKYKKGRLSPVDHIKQEDDYSWLDDARTGKNLGCLQCSSQTTCKDCKAGKSPFVQSQNHQFSLHPSIKEEDGTFDESGGQYTEYFHDDDNDEDNDCAEEDDELCSENDSRLTLEPIVAPLPTFKAENANGERMIGKYTVTERKARIERYRQKKLRMLRQRKITKYDDRKKRADSRMRFKGRFVSKRVEEHVMTARHVTTASPPPQGQGQGRPQGRPHPHGRHPHGHSHTHTHPSHSHSDGHHWGHPPRRGSNCCPQGQPAVRAAPHPGAHSSGHSHGSHGHGYTAAAHPASHGHSHGHPHSQNYGGGYPGQSHGHDNHNMGRSQAHPGPATPPGPWGPPHAGHNKSAQQLYSPHAGFPGPAPPPPHPPGRHALASHQYQLPRGPHAAHAPPLPPGGGAAPWHGHGPMMPAPRPQKAYRHDRYLQHSPEHAVEDEEDLTAAFISEGGLLESLGEDEDDQMYYVGNGVPLSRGGTPFDHGSGGGGGGGYPAFPAAEAGAWGGAGGGLQALAPPKQHPTVWLEQQQQAAAAAVTLEVEQEEEYGAAGNMFLY